MTVLLNSFEGGTSGTALTTGNTGGASGNAFDAISVGAAATLAFSNAQAAHGTLSCQVAIGGTSTTALAEWTTSMGTQATVWYRLYLYFTGNPSATVRPYAARSGASLAATVAVNTSGKLALLNAASSTQATFTNSIPLNKWFRIEGLITGNASAGVITCSLYDTPDSATADETRSVTAQNTTGLLSQYWFGEQASVTNVGPYWMDSAGISSTGPIGPVKNAVASGSSIVPSLIAMGAVA